MHVTKALQHDVANVAFVPSYLSEKTAPMFEVLFISWFLLE